MSGYLTRIAERAMNVAPVVHPNASLPFFASPEPMPVVETPAMEAESHARHTLRASVPLKPPRVAEESLAPVPQPPAVDSSVPAPAVPAPATPGPAGEIVANEAPVSTPASPAQARGRAPRPSPAVAPVRRAAPSRTLAAPGAAPAPAAADTQPLPAAALARVRYDTDRPSHSSEPNGPEVHIHIGRIELTALPEAAPPRRKAGTAKKPMSLDEYLQGRGAQKR
jgi:hypothetical protein